MKLNIPTFVLSGNFAGKSPWDKDIENYKKNISRIEHTIIAKPYFQTTLPTNFIEKIKWKLSLYKWNLLKNTFLGNFNDPSINNEEKYLQKSVEIIKEKDINTVILSVGPFKYSSILIELKKQFPKIKFIIDYRDYWEDALEGLNSQQTNTEIYLQKKVIESIDLILSPNNEMQKHYAETFNKKSYCLPHCFDTSDIAELDSASNIKLEKTISLIYGGAFYSNISENISLIKQLVNQLLNHKLVSADFYVSIKGYEAELKHPSIKRYDFIDTNQYFAKVQQADYAILILPPNRVNAMSSKFFELLALRKPILYFGGSGEVSEFLIKNNLGFHITANNITEQSKLILENLITKIIPDKNFDLTPFTFEHQTNLLVKELKQLCV